ncbi:MAG: endonuclease/exonuclease/phosphatase family protein [Dysgonomonas sp.]|uniref:endonuclease/exonuclease/phosphatase family protein n=1 Tax=Dysgonomonas sp. TaxID=1891233 RepID=UPI003A88CD49
MYLKNRILYIIIFILVGASCSAQKLQLKILQFNIWQEGTIVPDGYNAIVDQICESGADFITLSEVRNYKDTRFCDRIVQSLKEKGHTFYSFLSYDTGLLSKYPIIDSTTVFPCIDDHGSVYRALIDMDGQEVALYTAHLDYLNCTYYDIRGYSGSSWKPRKPMTDMDSIMMNNVESKRDNGIQAFLEYANQDKSKGRIILLGGDFNEPSFLDWTQKTKDLFDHNGLIVPWTVSTMLYANGYVDAYRELYPDPVTHPGFTYPMDNPLVEVKKLTWAPEADERERIDFIYYLPYKGLELKNVVIWGSDGSICRSERIKEHTLDAFHISGNNWPSDHKAVLATFSLKRK